MMVARSPPVPWISATKSLSPRSKQRSKDSQQELGFVLVFHPLYSITYNRQIARVLFVEYILESIKRLPVLRFIFIGSEKLAPCLFMFLIILESSHLLQNCLLSP